jgi:hypothetical protein
MLTRVWQQWLLKLTCLGAGLGFLTSQAAVADLRDAAPPGAFMAVYGMHNPERDYQAAHYAAVWKEVQDSRIFDKVLQLIQNSMSEGDAQQFVAVRDALAKAIEPIDFEKLLNAPEVLYAQQFEGPTSLQLVLIRVPDGGAESFKQGIVNLFDLAAGASQGKVPVATRTVAGVEMKFLQLPPQVPITLQPAIGVKGDVVVLTTSLNLAEESLKLLTNPSAESKFDDPRFVAAFKELPPAEDAVVVFDGRAMFEQLHGIPSFIDRMSNGNPEAARVSKIMNDLLGQMDAFDYEVTVGYTDGYRECMASYGRLSDVRGATTMGKMVGSQQPFEDWTKWVPSNATGFSMSGGVKLLPLYDWVMTTIPAVFPEAQEGLDQFEAVQNQFDVHLKADILEAFSGETVSLTFPGAMTPFGPGSQSATFLRCSKPERIQELLHRGLNAILEIPQVKAQGVSLKPVDGMDGFEELSANFFAMAGGIKPVIGFKDGWMVIASHKEAVETALAAQAGDGESWAGSDRFKSFGLEVPATVHSISYANTGETIRGVSMGLQQAGMFAPMIIGMAQVQNQGQQGGKELQTMQSALALLPSIGKIIGKFDFFDATLTACVPGSDAGTYRRDTITLIKPPAPPKPATGSKSATGTSK